MDPSDNTCAGFSPTAGVLCYNSDRKRHLFFCVASPARSARCFLTVRVHLTGHAGQETKEEPLGDEGAADGTRAPAHAFSLQTAPPTSRHTPPRALPSAVGPGEAVCTHYGICMCMLQIYPACLHIIRKSTDTCVQISVKTRAHCGWALPLGVSGLDEVWVLPALGPTCCRN